MSNQKCQCTDLEFSEIVANSISKAEVIRKCGLIAAGGNYATVNARIKKLNLSTSHFRGQAHNKNKVLGPKRPIEFYLQEDKQVSSNSLKYRLIKEGIFEHKCYGCNLQTWNSKPIPIELEHIDGNNRNNLLSNLTILCPNCHAQTDTYRGKNIKSYNTRIKNSPNRKTHNCPRCDVKILKTSEMCLSCRGMSRRTVERPSKEELQKLIQENSFCAIGRMFGVSDNAVRKWAINYDLEIGK